MSEHTNPQHIAKKLVVYRMPGMDAVRVRRDEPYGSDALTMDLYYPSDSTPETRLPAVVIITGFPGARLEKVFGCTFKDMGSTTSWARLIAASGMIAIAYTNREPAGDVQALLNNVRSNATALGIDANRIGLWAGSGHVPLALWLLMQATDHPLKCAALCYGYTLDAGGSTGIAEAAKAWGFVNPAAGKSLDDLPADLPLFIARAGRDTFAHLNEMLDRFVSDAVARNLPLTFVNHATGPHAFDLFDDSDRSRHIIEAILSFLRFNLLEDTKGTKDTKAVVAT